MKSTTRALAWRNASRGCMTDRCTSDPGAGLSCPPSRQKRINRQNADMVHPDKPLHTRAKESLERVFKRNEMDLASEHGKIYVFGIFLASMPLCRPLSERPQWTLKQRPQARVTHEAMSCRCGKLSRLSLLLCTLARGQLGVTVGAADVCSPLPLPLACIAIGRCAVPTPI